MDLCCRASRSLIPSDEQTIDWSMKFFRHHEVAPHSRHGDHASRSAAICASAIEPRRRTPTGTQCARVAMQV